MIVLLDVKLFIKIAPNIDVNNSYVFNLSSMYENIEKVDILPSVTNINYYDEKSFDMMYSNIIIGDNYYFYEFFSKIINPIYSGKNVFLLVDRNILKDAISESLCKLIQQRYGYNNIALINEVEDLDYIPKDNLFSVAGVYNLDIDKERYSCMYMSRNSSHMKDTGAFDGHQEKEYV